MFTFLNVGFIQKKVNALALAECLRGLPWPLLLAYEGYHGRGCVP